jgi:hypothetical protein
LNSDLKRKFNLINPNRWLNQHETIDRLNIQAHKNALNSTDEFVMDSFVTYEKVSLRIFSNKRCVGGHPRVRLAVVRDLEVEIIPPGKFSDG